MRYSCSWCLSVSHCCQLLEAACNCLPHGCPGSLKYGCMISSRPAGALSFFDLQLLSSLLHWNFTQDKFYILTSIVEKTAVNLIVLLWNGIGPFLQAAVFFSLSPSFSDVLMVCLYVYFFLQVTYYGILRASIICALMSS